MCLCSYEEISFLIQCQMVLLPHINFLISKHNKTTKIDPKIIVCTPSLSAGGGVVVVGNVGLNLLPNLQKRGRGLDVTLIFRGELVGKRGGDLFEDGGLQFLHKNKLKCGIFNDKKVDKQKCFSLSLLRIQTGKL